MGFIGPVVGALGWSLLLCRRCPEGTPAINYRICAGELSRALAAASALVLRPQATEYDTRMDAIFCDGPSEQCGALLFSICGSNNHYGWSHIDH